MAGRVHDDSGDYKTKLTEQDVLKAFDYETSPEEPMLKVSEINSALEDHFEIDVSGETVRRRLSEMEEDGLVASKQFGARAVGWTALVGPRLSDEVHEASDRSLEDEDTTPLEEVADDLGVDLD